MILHRQLPLAISGAFILCLTSVVLYLSRVCSRDPTSVFFDAKIAYEDSYSNVLRNEALEFVARMEVGSPFHRTTNQTPFLCIGIPSIMRKEEQYLHYAVGSLFRGLTKQERQEIVFLPFIAQTEPALHYGYGQSWLLRVADDLLEYNWTTPTFNRIRKLELAKNYWEKGLLDYTWILEKCFDTEASYVAIIEDDVIARPDWYRLTKKALQGIPSQVPFLYLRLFYSEEFLGWNVERAPTYVGWSLGAFMIVQSASFLVRSIFPSLRNMVRGRTLFIACSVICTTSIALFFMAGRMTVFPLKSGVVHMDDGCCGQGLLFPRDIVPPLTDWYRAKGDGHADLRTEQFAEHKGLRRWALTPSVLQHIGSRSSKGRDRSEDIKYNMTLAARVWSFAFEMNDDITFWLGSTDSLDANR